MAATYVTPAELRATLGIGTLYSDDVLELCCQTAENVLNKYLWFNEVPIVGVALYQNVATIVLASSGTFTKGQTVNIDGCGGSPFNGNHVITNTWPYTQGSSLFPVLPWFPYSALTFPKGYSLIQYETTHADVNYKLVLPYGKAQGQDTMATPYADVPEIQQAALMLAIDVWQARQAPASGGVSVDGYSPSPYRLGNTMLAKVRGLIAGYLSPRGMVG